MAMRPFVLRGAALLRKQTQLSPPGSLRRTLSSHARQFRIQRTESSYPSPPSGSAVENTR